MKMPQCSCTSCVMHFLVLCPADIILWCYLMFWHNPIILRRTVRGHSEQTHKCTGPFLKPRLLTCELITVTLKDFYSLDFTRFLKSWILMSFSAELDTKPFIWNKSPFPFFFSKSYFLKTFPFSKASALCHCECRFFSVWKFTIFFTPYCDVA